MRYTAALALTLSFGCLLLPAKSPVPRPAKEFTCSDANGKRIALSSYAGKVVVVQFLITSCSHCQAFSQTLTRLQAEYGPQGFQAVGVAIDDATPAMLRSYVEDHHLGISVGVASREAALEYLGFSLLERLSVPQAVVLDRSGQVRAQTDLDGTRELLDETYLRGLIASLLRESPHAIARK